jgi:hypothetical protein
VYSTTTMVTIRIMESASAFASPGWLRPVSLVNRLLICSGTMIPPCVMSAAAVAYAENAFANSRSVHPRNAGASSGPATYRQ